MNTSIYLITCALTLAQGPARPDWQLTPQLAQGLELVYNGTYLEESLVPHVQYQRLYKFETNVLVLDTGIKDWQIAVMTAISLQDGKAPGAKEGPSSVSLELARLDHQGRLRSSDKKLMLLPLKGPPLVESGFVVPAPQAKLAKDALWDVGYDNLPAQRWQIMATEPCGGVTCIKVAGIQQSADWDRPRADSTAWRRRDVIWIHPQLLIAQKVERMIERRDPARDLPTYRTIVSYEMVSRLQYPGPFFEDRKKDVFKASKFNEDAQQLLRQPGPNRQQIDGMIRLVSFHLDHRPVGQETPYRKAIVHLRAVLEKAQKGELPAPGPIDDPRPDPAKKTLVVGDRIPEFAVSSLTEEKALRSQDLRGKPFVVIFYNPGTPLGKETMTFARKLNDQSAGKVGIVAMAVTPDAAVARKQHQEMRLTFPILDGAGLRVTFGAQETPRFVVVDGQGLVRYAETGWGFQTPYEIEETVQKCLRP